MTSAVAPSLGARASCPHRPCGRDDTAGEFSLPSGPRNEPPSLFPRLAALLYGFSGNAWLERRALLGGGRALGGTDAAGPCALPGAAGNIRPVRRFDHFHPGVLEPAPAIIPQRAAGHAGRPRSGERLPASGMLAGVEGAGIRQ